MEIILDKKIYSWENKDLNLGCLIQRIPKKYQPIELQLKKIISNTTFNNNDKEY